MVTNNSKKVDNQESFQLGVKAHEVFRSFLPGSKFFNELDWHERAAWVHVGYTLTQEERDRQQTELASLRAQVAALQNELQRILDIGE